MEEYEKALADYSRAIELNPGLAQAYVNRAFANHRLSEYDRAWADVRKAWSLGAVVSPEFVDELAEASGRQE